MVLRNLYSIKGINECTCFNMINKSGILNSNGETAAFQLTLELPEIFNQVL